MECDELANYSEDNFNSMVASWQVRELRDLMAGADRKRLQQALLTQNIRWWFRFSAFVGGIVTTAFVCGYILARLSS